MYGRKIVQQNRNATNKRRKFMHFTWGMLFASLNHFVPRQFFLPGMMVISGTSLTVELLRYRKGFEWMNNLMHFVLGKSLRKNEMDGKFTGSFYYFSGVPSPDYHFSCWYFVPSYHDTEVVFNYVIDDSFCGGQCYFFWSIYSKII